MSAHTGQPIRLVSAPILLLLGACASSGPVTAQEGTHQVEVQRVVEGLEHPWGMAFLPDGAILVTERPGRLRLVRDGVLQPAPIDGVPTVRAQGQGGLLDVALHPRFSENRLVYLSYSKAGDAGATTAVARGRLDGNRLMEVEDILVADAWGTGGQHFGSRLAFDGRGYLYVTIGDRGQMRRAQDSTDHAGTTLRLHDDGRVPSDNPFVGREGRDEVYTYGNRNAQGMVVHPATGAVWQNEHGPRGGDEINLILAGRNYGWPLATGGVGYDGTPIAEREHGNGMEPPVVEWTPSIAPSGMTHYDGDVFPRWRGDFFVGALAGQHLRRVRIAEGRAVEQESLLGDLGIRIRDVRSGPDGFIYLLVDASQAPLLRLVPAAGGD
jgi:aldose sugar dehydrogenase